jgi:ABC-type histidine transport system ATPase subunit
MTQTLCGTEAATKHLNARILRRSGAYDQSLMYRYLAEGRIVEIGTPAQVLDNPQDQTLKDFLRRMH